ESAPRALSCARELARLLLHSRAQPSKPAQCQLGWQRSRLQRAMRSLVLFGFVLAALLNRSHASADGLLERARKDAEGEPKAASQPRGETKPRSSEGQHAAERRERMRRRTVRRRARARTGLVVRVTNPDDDGEDEHDPGDPIAYTAHPYAIDA